jgi:hypothetical protein
MLKLFSGLLEYNNRNILSEKNGVLNSSALE